MAIHTAKLTFLALRCADIEACRCFYEKLGFSFEPHKHGKGETHYCAEGCFAFELYSATEKNPVNKVSFGLQIDGYATIILRDPDDRRVEITGLELTL